jgi:biotin operon repressor
VDLDAIVTFVRVAETGQFQAAADELGVSQQATSKRIAALERELGVTLFARNARGVRLTVDGQALLPQYATCCAPPSEPGRRSCRDAGRCGSTSPTAGPRPPTSCSTSTGNIPGIDLDVVTLTGVDAASALAEVGAGIDGDLTAVVGELHHPDWSGIQIGPSRLDEHIVLDGTIVFIIPVFLLFFLPAQSQGPMALPLGSDAWSARRGGLT